MAMAWKHRIGLPQILCYSMKAVSQGFYSFTDQRKSLIKATLKYISGYIREAGTRLGVCVGGVVS